MSTVQITDVALDENPTATDQEPKWIPKDLEKVEIDPTEFVEESINTDKGNHFFTCETLVYYQMFSDLHFV